MNGLLLREKATQETANNRITATLTVARMSRKSIKGFLLFLPEKLRISYNSVESCRHGQRHSCVSLLLANGVPMKQIQEWLGHSDFSTTANVYAHLDYNSKISSVVALAGGLNLE